MATSQTENVEWIPARQQSAGTELRKNQLFREAVDLKIEID
jgi:hypothetical protein